MTLSDTVWGLQCNACGKTGHFKSACRIRDFAGAKSVKYDQTTKHESEDEDEFIGRVFTVSSRARKRRRRRRDPTRQLPHTEVNEFGQWSQTEPESHPVVIVSVSVSEDSYRELNIPEPARHQPTNVQAIADTGAQVLVGGVNLAHQLGVRRHELIPVSHRIGGGDSRPLRVIGGMLLDISYQHNSGEFMEYRQLCYVAEDIDGLLLSKKTLENLGIIPKDFPKLSALSRPSYNGHTWGRGANRVLWSDWERSGLQSRPAATLTTPGGRRGSQTVKPTVPARGLGGTNIRQNNYQRN